MKIRVFERLLSPCMSTHAGPVARFFTVAALCFAAVSIAHAAPQVTAPQIALSQPVPQIGATKSLSATSAQVSDVARELVCDCPDCGKQALDQCPNCAIGRKYRAVIAGQLKQGRTKAQIINYFGNTYGEHILGTPRQQGFGRAAFTLPALAVLMGLLPLSIALRRRKNERDVSGMARRAGSLEASAVASAKPMADDPRVAAALRDYDF